MNSQLKVIKANFVSEEWINQQQPFAKKQYKLHLKHKEINKTEEDHIPSISSQNNYRKEIEKW